MEMPKRILIIGTVEISIHSRMSIFGKIRIREKNKEKGYRDMTYDDFTEAVLCGREIEFTYKGVEYFITDYDNVATLEDCTNHKMRYFGEMTGTFEDRMKGREQMLYEKIFENKTFQKAFSDIFVQFIY